MSSGPDRRHSGPVLARNSIVNVTAHLAPVIAALVAIPILVSQLGTARFGILTLAWIVAGYFSLFDIGIGRSLTQLISARFGSGRSDQVPDLVWTGLSLLALFGMLGTAAAWMLASPLVHVVLKIPTSLQPESVAAVRLLAISIPFVVLAAGLKGVLEADQRFGFLALVQVPLAVLTLGAPILVLPFSHRVDLLVGALLVTRIGALLAYGLLMLRVLPWMRTRPRFVVGEVKTIVSFGGWLTVSSIISPMMVYFDRIAISGLISVSAVAYYVTPYEVVTRVLRLPVAVTAVFFPAFAMTHGSDPRRTGLLFQSVCQAILVLTVLPLLVIFLFAGEGLSIWVGADFAAEGTLVARWLVVGVFFNSLAQAPFALVQGLGRPDLTARFHLWELPVYLVVLYVLLVRFGITGAACAWMLRAAADAVLLFIASSRLLETGRDAVIRVGWWALGTSMLFGLATLPATVASKIAFLLTVSAGLGILAARRPGGLGAVYRLLRDPPRKEMRP